MEGSECGLDGCAQRLELAGGGDIPAIAGLAFDGLQQLDQGVGLLVQHATFEHETGEVDDAGIEVEQALEAIEGIGFRAGRQDLEAGRRPAKALGGAGIEHHAAADGPLGTGIAYDETVAAAHR